jgi:hypothetical protein
MTDESNLLFDQAMQEWDVANEKDSISSYKNAEGLFLLGLKKLDKPIPRIYSFLSMLYYDMALCYARKQNEREQKAANESINSATKYANLALQHEPLEFRAQLIKTYIASDNILYLSGGMSNIIPQSKDVVTAIFEGVGRAINTGAAMAQVSMSKSAFKQELEKLLVIYTELSKEYILSVTEFFFFANKLLGIADFCSENKLFGAKEIYTLICNVDINELDADSINPEMQSEILKEISTFKKLAEARLMTL